MCDIPTTGIKGIVSRESCGIEFSSRGMPQMKYHLAYFFLLNLRILLKDKTKRDSLTKRTVSPFYIQCVLVESFPHTVRPL
jgi:hypothetical protein